MRHCRPVEMLLAYLGPKIEGEASKTLNLPRRFNRWHVLSSCVQCQTVMPWPLHHSSMQLDHQQDPVHVAEGVVGRSVGRITQIFISSRSVWRKGQPRTHLHCVSGVFVRSSFGRTRLLFDWNAVEKVVSFASGRPSSFASCLSETFVESGSGRRLSLLDKNGTYDTYGKSQTAKIGTERKIHPLTTMPSPDGKRLIPGLCPK